MQGKFEFRTVDTGAARLNVALAGPADAPLILFLHGFPEFWQGWRPVMERLADRWRVAAPDQRGYNRSSKPGGVEAYRAKALVADIAALADELSPDRPFVLAGHDWGASIAYAYAMAHPARLSHLVIANGVHPAPFQRAILHDPEQRRASQYIHRLRAADAEDRLSENGYERLFGMLSKFSSSDWMGEGDRAAYLDAWRQPGALTGMLNWYRATPIVVPKEDEAPSGRAPIEDLDPEILRIRMPHLLIWGEEDTALRPSTIEGLDAFVPDLTIERVPDAGHWIIHERPDEVASAIRAFISDEPKRAE